MKLVIVESPTKAKTIRKFLGADYKVMASMGHVRDLPSSSDEIPAAYKKTEWGQLGVNVQKDFEPLYVIPAKKSATIKELKEALKNADALYLATDEDREGESISWHLLQLLKPSVPVYRMVFHEITKPAIEGALAHPRDLDNNLVHAQETRRVLDRLVGYSVSPVLWKKIAFGLSAGRVQSAALKAIVDRERARMAFVKAGYWDVSAVLRDQEMNFEAKLTQVNGKTVAQGKDFDENTGKLAKPEEVTLLDQTMAEKIAQETKTATWKVLSVTEKPTTRRPPAPFITSTLQQEANRKLGLSTKDAMRVAQSLYEHGHITYMRTDSTNLSEEAIKSVRTSISTRFGSEFLPGTPRQYANKVKGAQEAHEAIRPSLAFASPDEIGLTGAERDVYELIWMRTLASQMTDSEQMQTSVQLDAAGYQFTATGLRILSPGFLRAYVEGKDDTEMALGDQERPLPALKEGDKPECLETKPLGHETKPPSRFTEAGLIQFMEKEGIGRPSTYATIISTLLGRNYVHKERNALMPTFTAFAVTSLLEKHFADLVDTKFTSRMEESLDEIAEGKEERLPYLQAFFLGDKGLLTRIEKESKDIDPETARTVKIPGMEDVEVRIGRFGPYFEAVDPRSQLRMKASVPENLAPADFTKEQLEEVLKKSMQGPSFLGADVETGKSILLRSGSYGPYLQLGEDVEGSKEKPKRVSIPKDVPLETLDYTKAQLLISLPKVLGKDVDTGVEIKVGIGRFGPYVVRGDDFRSLKKEDSIFTMTLERALQLLAEPKGSRRGGSAPGKVLGSAPKDKKPVTLHNGKYGWYVKHGTKNATIPKDLNPETVTLEQALEILGAKKKATKKKKETAE